MHNNPLKYIDPSGNIIVEVTSRTYLPYKEIKSPVPTENMFGNTTYYLGDNRVMTDYSSKAFRTSQEFTIDTEKGTVTVVNQMGTTHKVIRDNKTGEVEKTKEKTQVINSKTMAMENVKVDANGIITFKATISASNPLAKMFGFKVGPDINYEYYFSVNPEGKVNLKGTRDLFPAYEIFVKVGEGKAELYDDSNPYVLGSNPNDLFGLTRESLIITEF